MLHWQQEMQRPGSEEVVAGVDNFDLSVLSEATSRIENALSWSDADHQINECEGDDGEYYVRTMLIGALVIVMTSWMKQHTQLVFRQRRR